MKKFIALVLTLALAVSLCACSSKASSQTVTFTVPMDDSTYTFTAPVDENGESATLPGGATIALAAEQASLDDGADTLLWKGIQTFAGTYGYTAENHTAADTSVEAAEAALREAAESGAALVVWPRRCSTSRTTTPAYTTCCLTASPTTAATPTIPPSPTSTVSSSRRSRPVSWRVTPP